MGPAMERREHRRRPSPVRSNSPNRSGKSPDERRDKMTDQRREKMTDRERNREGEKLSERSGRGDRDRERQREKEDRTRSSERSREREEREKIEERGSKKDVGRHREREREERVKPVEKEPVRNSERSREREEVRDESPRTRRLNRAQEERESNKERRHEREKNGREERENTEERESRKERRHEREERASKEERESKRRREKSESRDEVQDDARGDDNSRSENDDSLAKMNLAAQELEAKEKQKPSFELSGKLAEETNKVRGVTLIFTEPQEARKPDIRWRLYVFKGGEVLNEPLYVHRQSCYLFGRERRVADIPTDHPSCSKQHAVLQFRLVEKEQPDGMMKQLVRPYLMDLESTNGTFINDNRLEARCYYELFEKDTIKFGNSSREYVLLHENSNSAT